jgi:hypothetical protein
LASDDAWLQFVFAQGTRPHLITAETVRPDSNLNLREIPISLQIPD